MKVALVEGKSVEVNSPSGGLVGMKMGRYFAAVLLAVTMFMAAAGAQDPGPPPSGSQQEPNGAPPDASAPNQDSENPQLQERESSEPKSSVARVSSVHGNVSMQRGDSNEWAAVTLNTPLVQGDQIATGDRSRTEVQLDFANVMRLAAGSAAKIADLERAHIQVQVSQGYTYYTISKGNEAEVEIDTPNVAVHPLGPGHYRVQVNSDSETDVIVRDGEAEITTPQGSTRVKEGELITIHGTDNPEYKVENAPPGDDWDRFNNDRDHLIQSANAVRKTNPYYTGAQDLDAYGRWVNAPGYGEVWQPYQQGPNWAPYQDGRWVWEPYWGWTWVSYEPWGWAPYHYGRWFYWNTGWVWWPGPIYPWYRPVWAPAYVSFFGFGGHVGFGAGFGFGSVGWLPCGPFDPFFPWFGRGFNRVTIVNINNFNVRNFNGRFVGPLGIAGRHPFISNISMARTNARVRAGITSVSGADFARGGMGSRRFGMDEGQLREGRMMTANIPVVPTRESLHSGNVTRSGGAGGFQPRTSGRFVTRGAAPAGPPAFHEQAAQMEHVVRSSGRTVGESPNGRFGNDASRGGAAAGSRSPGTSGSQPMDHGSGRMTQSTGGDRAVGGEGSRGGWRSFGGGNGSQPQNSGSVQGGPQGNRATPTEGIDRGGASRNGGEGSTGKPQLQMAKPIVTPRTSTPSYTYTRPSTPPPSSSRGSGNYGSSAGSSSGSYSGRSPGGDYSGGRGSGSYGGGSRSNGGYSGGGSHNSGGYSGAGHSSSGGGYRGGGYSGGGHSSSSGGYSGGGRSSGGGGHSSGGHSSGGGSNHNSGGGHDRGHSR